MAAAGARCRGPIVGNRQPRGARVSGRRDSGQGGDRAVGAEGWQAATAASLLDGELADVAVGIAWPWRAGAGQACGVQRTGMRQGHGAGGRGGNTGHGLCG
jgi:hypothetical protein